MATAYTKSKILSKNNIDSKDYVTPREPPYPPPGVDVQKMLDMRKKMLDNIVEYLNKKFSKHDSYPEVMMEPGRALIGNAIDLNYDFQI